MSHSGWSLYIVRLYRNQNLAAMHFCRWDRMLYVWSSEVCIGSWVMRYHFSFGKDCFKFVFSNTGIWQKESSKIFYILSYDNYMKPYLNVSWCNMGRMKAWPHSFCLSIYLCIFHLHCYTHKCITWCVRYRSVPQPFLLLILLERGNFSLWEISWITASLVCTCWSQLVASGQ